MVAQLSQDWSTTTLSPTFLTFSSVTTMQIEQFVAMISPLPFPPQKKTEMPEHLKTSPQQSHVYWQLQFQILNDLESHTTTSSVHLVLIPISQQVTGLESQLLMMFEEGKGFFSRILGGSYWTISYQRVKSTPCSISSQFPMSLIARPLVMLVTTPITNLALTNSSTFVGNTFCSGSCLISTTA